MNLDELIVKLQALRQQHAEHHPMQVRIAPLDDPAQHIVDMPPLAGVRVQDGCLIIEGHF